MATSRETFFASCAPGLEPFLLREARELRLGRIEGRPGGVHFTGTLFDAGRANLWLRTASRVLMQVAKYAARDADEIYRGAREVAWGRFLGPDGTFLVDARSKRSQLGHSRFIEQRVKDAVADIYRETHQRRPSIHRDDPDLRIHARLYEDICTLSVDTSGEPLFKRGWRKFGGDASLKEPLAAACVLASRWDLRSPLLDPFCGSGTILIEAAFLAAGLPPGLDREYGFMRWPGHDPETWRRTVEEARAAAVAGNRKPPILLGWDADERAVAGARENVLSAGFSDRIRIEVGGADTFSPRPGWNAFIVTNPPYGERLASVGTLVPVYERFGKTLREVCGGYEVAILSGSQRLTSALHLKPRDRYEVKNGALPCELLTFDIAR
jgi:23S rRNA G2445 N2-methylase RlmL